jgi:hypothetical protein
MTARHSIRLAPQDLKCTTASITEANQLANPFRNDADLAKGVTDAELLAFLGKFDSYETTDAIGYLIERCEEQYETFMRFPSSYTLMGFMQMLGGLAGSNVNAEQDFVTCAAGVGVSAVPYFSVSDLMLFNTHPKYSQACFCAVEFSKYENEDDVNLRARMWTVLIGSEARMVLGVSNDGIRLLFKRDSKKWDPANQLNFGMWPADGGFYHPDICQNKVGLQVLSEILRITSYPERKQLISRRIVRQRLDDLIVEILPVSSDLEPFTVYRLTLDLS